MTNVHKKLLLTFDYELFFNQSGTPEKCILEPTEKLIQIFSRLGIKTTFFVDILYYLRMLENKASREKSKLIKTQLQELVSHGHRIELHLHPHWLDAAYNNGVWIFPDYRYFRVQNLPEDKMADAFKTGVGLLEEVAQEVQPDYKVIAFRAGGWCVQPFDKLAKEFAANGIKIDSSVSPGIKGESDTHFYDFTTAPNLEYYRFSNDPVQIDSNGPFYEIPITSYQRSFTEKTIRKLTARLRRTDFRICGDGIGKGVQAPWRERVFTTTEMFSIEYMLPTTLSKRVAESDQWLVNLLSHPKGLAPISYQCIEKLYADGFGFLNIHELYNEIIKMNSPGK